jgi:hypothetical protein
MKLLFKMNWSLRRAATDDLGRRHKFAHERVGFFGCRAAATNNGMMVLAESYDPVADDHYVRDESVGARINGAAIRHALQLSLTKGASVFHVHMHGHVGTPRPSKTDLVESNKFVPDFFNVTPSMPHGTIILSRDSAFGLCWVKQNTDPIAFHRLEIVGSPLRIVDISI